jgi:glycosyltransferase involved in cell wall biosynthesis
MTLPKTGADDGGGHAPFAAAVGFVESGNEGGTLAGPPASPELVTVIVPAYNAGATIGATLDSIRAQTHTSLEVLVIDDGSTDATAETVLRHASVDPRIRLIRQSNKGVAAARNRGIAEARGEYLAPIDADDLWRPDKIERQMQLLRAGGSRVGLVYCWFALIDENSRIVSLRHRPVDEGDVLARMCLGNVVGNGSSALIRKSVAREVGGYDSSLRARQAQGCEDLKFHLQIAARYHFAVVKDHLTGYRRTRFSMSSDVAQMIRSYELVAAEFVEKHPQYFRQFHEGKNFVLSWLLTTAFWHRRYRDAARLTRMMLINDRRYALLILAMMPAILTRNALASVLRRWLKTAPWPRSGFAPSHSISDSVALTA